MSKKHHENCPTNCLAHSEISPSRKTIFKSPHSNHIPMAPSKQPKTVSYGQLQIILQNVQSIKAKAFVSIRQVEQANEKLQAQVNIARDELIQFKELQAREQGREGEIEAIRRGCQQEIERIKQAGEHTKEALESLRKQYEGLARAKREVDEELIENRRVQLQNEQRSREYERKYEELVAQLTEDKPKMLGDIIWRLKDCHPLSQFFSSRATLTQQIILLQERANQLQEMNENHRQATASTAVFFQQLRDENTELRERVQNKEEEVSSLRKQIEECTIREAEKCKDGQIEQYQRCISESAKQKCECEEQRVVLSAKLKELDEQIEAHGKVKKEEQQRQAYQRLVEGLCDEEEDYAQLVGKLKYFQSFKSEHYYNVEKIEYLCKMLDKKQIQGVLEGLRNHKMLTTLTRLLPIKPSRLLLRSPTRNPPLKTPSIANQIKLFDRPKLDQLSSLFLNQASMGDSVIVSIPKKRHTILSGRYQSILKPQQKTQVHVEPLPLQLEMKRIPPNIRDETLTTLLRQISGQENVSTLRIYRETLRQIYTARYGKDVLTGFFNFQYIEDYDSLRGYLKNIVQMNHQQIILLCFLTLDHDGDGVITNKDVFSTLVDCDNPLINADLYELVKYIHSYTQQQSLHDPANALCNSKMTLTKFRLICKKKEQRENELSKKSVATGSLSKGPMRLRTSLSLPPPGMAQDRVARRDIPSRMFTFQPIDQNEMDDKEERRVITEKFLNYLIQCQYKFGINLDRLETIFKFKVPETFYDILFVLGGLKIQGKSYQPLYIPSNDIKAGCKSIVQHPDYTRQLKLFRQSCNSLATVRLQRHVNTPTN